MFSSESLKPVEVHFPEWGVFALESHHAPQFRMPDTAHPFYKLMYVLKGHGEVLSASLNVKIAPGDVVAVAPGFRHRIVDDENEPLALIVLCIQKNVAEFLQDAAGLEQFPKLRVFRSNALSSEARSILRQILFEQTLRRTSAAGMITGLTLQLMAAVLRAHQRNVIDDASPRAQAGPEARVRAYARELEHNFWSSDKIDNVAARLGMSRRYFTRLFRAATGVSWLDRVRELRIQHARSLLETTERSITAIAFECGFDDLSSFYRAFKALMGVTPQQYRSAKGRSRVRKQL
ncbi:MAG TPA: AraC family transcriptional regulator [Planctomycetota bacterium]|nr:AraC family transcriptional regulator [Planctomycetota bacterium]